MIDYLTYTQAKKDYCLTDSMFKLVGDPDITKANPHSSKSKMRLYSKERIEKWVSENDELVKKAVLRREKLSKIQKKRHDIKRREIQAVADSWKPKFVKKVPSNVIFLAENYYRNKSWDYTNNFRPIGEEGLIAFIRHTYTDYEEFLGEIPAFKGQTGNYLLYTTLRPKVDDMIRYDSNCSGLIHEAIRYVSLYDRCVLENGCPVNNGKLLKRFKEFVKKFLNEPEANGKYSNHCLTLFDKSGNEESFLMFTGGFFVFCDKTGDGYFDYRVRRIASTIEEFDSILKEVSL